MASTMFMAGPAISTWKRSHLRLREELVGRAAALVLDGFAGHLDEAAQRNRRDLVLGAAAGEPQQTRAEPDREGKHAHADAPGGEEVAQLVDENEHADDKSESEQRQHGCRAPYTGNSKLAISAREYSRAQRSASRTPASESVRCTSCADIVPLDDLGNRGK